LSFNLDFGSPSEYVFNLESVCNTLDIRRSYSKNVDYLLVIYFTKLLNHFSEAVLKRFQADVIWDSVDTIEGYIIFQGIVPPAPGSVTERVFKVTIPLSEISVLKTEDDLIALTNKYVAGDSQNEPAIDFNYSDLTDDQLKSLKSTVTILQSQGMLGTKC
jgi:hypothetical protein